ncbi:unnamed protein product [Candidula unifasciata]|uniref:Uncharacterized protein n=1 Tax=Candidula unifasciata TaxID=100452 RepID=A0A8S4A2Q6_9EUPU|nr:unnamed protein product [Candidula unifasciata]
MSESSSVRNIRLLVETDDPMFYGQKKLKVRGRDLVHLSKDVFKLMDLEVLDLSPERQSCLNYKLPMIPRDIGKLHCLTTLLLDTNELLQVPVEITLLTNLERLTLSNNHLTELPRGFKRLQKLESLHLANNKLEKFPLEVCDITSLVFLDASDNLIKLLPKKISQLTNLETLLLFINQLTKLPDTIVNMRALRCLWLGNNHICHLPKGFGYLSKLDWKDRYTTSTLDGNPLLNPPLEICKLGPEAIERFQGVGPNIDAEKLAEEERKRTRRRTIPVLGTSQSVNGNVPSGASGLKTKSDSRKVLSNGAKTANNIVNSITILDRQRK